MKIRSLLVGAAAAFLLIPVACGGKSEEVGDGDGGDGDGSGTSSSADPAAKAESCATLCEELEDCEGLTTESCTDSCTGNTTTSVAGQEAFSTCFSSSVCESEDETGLLLALACVPSQLRGLELSEEQETYCDTTVAKFNECAETEPEVSPLGSCEDVIGVVSDDVLQEFNECAERECGNLELCIAGELLQNIDIAALESDELDPQALTSLITLGALVSQLGFAEETEDFDIFGEFLGGGDDEVFEEPGGSDPGDPDNMGGAGG